jgi:hypothetical protein
MVGDEEKTITIKIAQEFHVVGLAEWEAGFYLAEFILTHPGTHSISSLPRPRHVQTCVVCCVSCRVVCHVCRVIG